MSVAEENDAVQRALDLMREHPAVGGIGEPARDEASGTITVEATFAVNLPSEWRAEGRSPSGIGLSEAVRFDFPTGFPMVPPRLSLREDFTRNLPHMMPWMIEGRPVPCVYDGDLAELLYQQGLAGILNQTAVWLDRAVDGTLIDPEQGWEPVRRDAFSDLVVVAAEPLQALVDRRGGYRFLAVNYLRVVGDGATEFVHCELSAGTVGVKGTDIPKAFSEGAGGGGVLRRGSSLCLVVWPGKEASGRPIICDSYFPETVGDVGGLRDRAELYGCLDELGEGIELLRRRLSGKKGGPFPMVVVLLARRPCRVIGSASAIELCPYVVDVTAPGVFASGRSTKVRPAAHREAISRALLARMAGAASNGERPDWTLVGAGSLGSKLALHMARAGNGPSVVVDRSSLSPHNAARHALTPPARDSQIHWGGGKAGELTEALAGLDQRATAVRRDAVSLLMSGDKSQRAWSRRSWAVVNATASLALREALGAHGSSPTRVVETSLFAGGLVGVVTVEGPERNPSTTDLMAEVYATLQEDKALASIVFDDDGGVGRQATGQGCGSMTMTMSDGRLSLFAAGAAEYLLAKQGEGLPEDGGEVLIGRLSEGGLGVDWRRFSIPPVTELRMTSGAGWHVHMHPRALSKIQEEASRWSTVETGGVVMGRLSEVSRVAHVVDVLDPPEDSIRSRDEFVLGTKGLRRRIGEYSEAVNWSLYCLGTWHSHLSEGGPSPKDWGTAKAVTLARLTPSVFLIKTPTHFHAFAAGM